LLALDIIAPFEALYSTGGINDSLLAGEERVTFTAKLYFQLLLGRPGLKPVSAGADDLCISIICRMYFLFHYAS
jgi:hypothetical protein